MQLDIAEWIGVAAAAAVSVYAANVRTTMPLRIAAIVASALAMIYSVLHGFYPVVVLVLIVLAINLWRLIGMMRLLRGIDAALKGDMNVEWLLPYTRPKHFEAGQIMMARGDYATAAFYIVSGEVEIVELNQTAGQGTLLGEIGLFAPDGRRTATVRCKTDVAAAVLDYDQFKELYFQNPQFGFRLLHLVVARLQRAAPPSGALV